MEAKKTVRVEEEKPGPAETAKRNSKDHSSAPPPSLKKTQSILKNPSRDKHDPEAPLSGDSAPGTPGPGDSVLSKLREETVLAHNIRRQKHGAPPICLSDELNEMAQKWANRLATTGTFNHSPDELRKGAGENIAAHSHVLLGKQLVDMWYNEVKNYKFESPGFAPNSGHFTQVVWKASTELGVGMSSERGSHGMYVYVVNYKPHGNTIGQFEVNVLRSGSKVLPRVTPADKKSRGPANSATSQKPSAAPTSAATPEAEKVLAKLREETLKAHNVRRQWHGAPPVQLHEQLNALAQHWADKLCQAGQFLHSPEDLRQGAGENIAAHSNVLTGDQLVEMWYCEVKNYNFRKPGFAVNTGHFTQLVWIECTHIGVGMSSRRGPHGMYTYVVNYWPHGNIIGQFDVNVLPRAHN